MYAVIGASHWDERVRRAYRGCCLVNSGSNVRSDIRISSILGMKTEAKNGYYHVTEIRLKREDDREYKIQQGDFSIIRLEDIEDMLLLMTRDQLTHIPREDLIALNTALRMFTRSVVIKSRVEDLQLGVESYQRRLNLTRPVNQVLPQHVERCPYTGISVPNSGIFYLNSRGLMKFMRVGELHKYSDGTLIQVRDKLEHLNSGGTLPEMTEDWHPGYRQMAKYVIKKIDQKLRERRLMRSLERFVGGRPYLVHHKLLQRSI